MDFTSKARRQSYTGRTADWYPCTRRRQNSSVSNLARRIRTSTIRRPTALHGPNDESLPMTPSRCPDSVRLFARDHEPYPRPVFHACMPRRRPLCFQLRCWSADILVATGTIDLCRFLSHAEARNCKVLKKTYVHKLALEINRPVLSRGGLIVAKQSRPRIKYM